MALSIMGERFRLRFDYGMAPVWPATVASLIHPGGINFWDALDAGARDEFRRRAREHTYIAGEPLMREGERANHVAVLSAGRVRVHIQGGDDDRTLAERGPGDLVGERAALHESVRSATVVALEPVRALIMTTADFAVFTGGHPEVVPLIENLIYARLTEAASSGRRAAPALRGQNCTVVFTDVVGFASGGRDDRDRLEIRQATAAMTISALGPFWAGCRCEDRGDGLLIVVPPDIPTAGVLERLTTVLPAELARHNRGHGLTLQVRLRVAVSVGPVVEDDIGLAGEAIIHAARMLDAPSFKQAVAAGDGPVAIIASAFVYDTAIRHGGQALGPACYTEVLVSLKEACLPAWIRLIGATRPAPARRVRAVWGCIAEARRFSQHAGWCLLSSPPARWRARLRPRTGPRCE